MATSSAAFNAQIIEEFHANQGRVGGIFEGAPPLLLHHTGAKSDKNRINPLGYHSDGGRYVVCASNGGAPRNPDWYHNLKTHPNITIEVWPTRSPCKPAKRRAKNATASFKRRSTALHSFANTRTRPGARFR
jgi:deazaflavin-dependent oxidoreductase (nitroreductase family)